LSRHEGRIALLLACLVFLLLLPFQRGHLVSTDETGLFEVSRSLAERGSIQVPRQRHVYKGRNGGLYHQYALGQALLAVPFYGLGSLAEATLPWSWSRAIATPDSDIGGRRVEGGVEVFSVGLYPFFVSGLLVAVFFLFERRLGVTLRNAILCSLLLGTCSYVALMSTFFMRHGTTTLCLLGALYCFHSWRERGRLRDLWIGSALASSILLVRLPDGVAGPVLGAYLAFAALQRRSQLANRADGVLALVAVLTPLGLALAAHFALNYYRWGLWIGSPIVEAGAFHTPLYLSGYANLFSPGMSVFVFTPLLLLTPWTLPILYRRHRPECLAVLGFFVVYWIVFSRYDGWAGLWSMPGPRYLFAVVPLLMLPLGLWLDQVPGRLKWLPVVCLAALGAFVQIAFMATSWGLLIRSAGWEAFEGWSFLFLPDASPPVEAIRALLAGRLNDMWIVGLAQGAWLPTPLPGAAVALVAGWGLLTGGCAWRLWTHYHRVRQSELSLASGTRTGC
jgi:hypothetical protein